MNVKIMVEEKKTEPINFRVEKTLLAKIDKLRVVKGIKVSRSAFTHQAIKRFVEELEK